MTPGINEEVLSPTEEVLSEDEPCRTPDACLTSAPRIPPPPPSIVNSKVLILFSGSKTGATSLSGCFHTLGVDSITFDILEGKAGDLADDAVWRPLLTRIHNGEFACLVAGPPCSTFSRARLIPGGPPPLRGLTGKERYGLPRLTVQQSELVRAHNLLAVRTAAAASVFLAQGKPFLIEQPALRVGEVSMFNLDEFVQLMKNPSVLHFVAPQCSFGASAKKMTSWVTAGLNLDDMPPNCTHTTRTWYAKDGSTVRAKHPPSRGTKRFFEDADKASQDINSSAFVTSDLAAYPDQLNQYIADKVTVALRKGDGPAPTPQPQDSFNYWDDRLGKEKVTFDTRLRGTPALDLKA